MHLDLGASSTGLATVARPHRRMTVGLGGGVALEWFDRNVYDLMAAFLAPQFFPSDDQATPVVQGLATGAQAGVANAIGAELAPTGEEGRYLAMISGTFIGVGLPVPAETSASAAEQPKEGCP
jgi:MFS family permease